MNIAINLAYSNLGLTYPNPSVGAVLVKDSKIIAKSQTEIYGGSHAEYRVIRNAIKDNYNLEGSELYVTLEPCCHIGKNPACSSEIIKAGIKKVFYIHQDPNPLVRGKGIKNLTDAGINCIQLTMPTYDLYDGFFNLKNKNLPIVNLKIATSLDSKIALANGESKWITNSSSRNFGQLLRLRNDILLTSAQTILIDDPALTCRVSQNKKMHLAILDRELKLNLNLKIFNKNLEKIIIFFDKNIVKAEALDKYKNLNFVYTVGINSINEKLNLTDILESLAKFDYHSILVEAGSQLSSAFLNENLVDNFYLFSSNKLLGKDALSAYNILSPEKIINCRKLRFKGVKYFDEDLLRIYSFN